MTTNLEDRFTDALSRVPELPGSVYHGAVHRIRRGMVMRFSALAAAACLLLALGGVYEHRSSFPAMAVSKDVAEDLQYVGEYLNGEHVKAELATDVCYDDGQNQ